MIVSKPVCLGENITKRDARALMEFWGGHTRFPFWFGSPVGDRANRKPNTVSLWMTPTGFRPWGDNPKNFERETRPC